MNNGELLHCLLSQTSVGPNHKVGLGRSGPIKRKDYILGRHRPNPLFWADVDPTRRGLAHIIRLGPAQYIII